EGDNNTKKPSSVKMVERAKWMAWDAIKGMSKEDALRGYLRVFGEEYLPAGERDNDSPSSTIASKFEPVESKSQRKAIA
ncbi:acyl-CoA-binding protein, partial [Francisella tularensis subsp. holarctica]|uniref:acyl-CoA-binding protein n=1 Tax=Francisella tularensis TaxID=263 RepID=UPI0023819D27